MSLVTIRLMTLPERAPVVLIACVASFAGIGAAADVASGNSVKSVVVLGPRTVSPGYEAYFSIAGKFADPYTHLYFDRVVLPAGFTHVLRCAPDSDTCFKTPEGRAFQYGGNNPVLFQVSIARHVAPGEYKLLLQVEAAKQPRTLEIPVTVRVPEPLTRGAYSGKIPKIPNLKDWEYFMRTLGEKWCENPAEQMKFGWEGQVWYYDGARVYFQIAAYDVKRKKKWEACALNIARQYRDYVTNNGGHVQGWRVFPHGLRMAYERTGDESYKRAVMLLAENSPYGKIGGGVSDGLIRETAYALQAYIAAERLGAPRHRFLNRAVAYLLGHFDMYLVTGDYYNHQTFMDGLAAEALIEYYELTRDPRIPGALKQLAGWLWEKGWNRKDKQMVYSPDAPGPKCSEGCQSYQTALINLVVPLFAWLWQATGDPIYLSRGDEIFAHALDHDVSYSGKIFSQNYRWSFDYVRWRSPLITPAAPSAK